MSSRWRTVLLDGQDAVDEADALVGDHFVPAPMRRVYSAKFMLDSYRLSPKADKHRPYRPGGC
jgi:hypothetical protein